MRVVVAGAGVFGCTTALALARRGHDVTLLEAGAPPHPLAESTDVSKIVRLDYGADEDYTALMERALDGWRRWNRASPSRPLLHETGVALLARAPLDERSFEGASRSLLTRRGHPLERLDAAAIARRFPAFAAAADAGGRFVDGYFNPQGGWAAAATVVAWLVDEARAAGVTLRPHTPLARVEEAHARVTAAVAATGERIAADAVVVAAGAWTQELAPALAPSLRAVGQPVFHLRPAEARAALFEPARFPVFTADIARTGWYGFPLTPTERGPVVKIAHHGAGRAMRAGDESARVVDADDEAALRSFLAAHLPALADAEIVHRRVCVYGDSLDEHFLVDRDPACAGLVVAAGGSGHGFKFAPAIGDLVADVVEERPPPAPLDERLRARFRWRLPDDASATASPALPEAARHRQRPRA